MSSPGTKQSKLEFLYEHCGPNWRPVPFNELYDFCRSREHTKVEEDNFLDHLWREGHPFLRLAWSLTEEALNKLDSDNFDLEDDDDEGLGDKEAGPSKDEPPTEEQRQWLRTNLLQVREFLDRFSDPVVVNKEFEALQQAERARLAARREEAERESRARREGNDRNFLSSDRIDFNAYLTLPSWSLDEAVSLSFGKTPDQIMGWLGGRTKDDSTAVIEFYKRQNLFKRAADISEVKETDRPAAYIKWADGYGISYPSCPANDVSNLSESKRPTEKTTTPSEKASPEHVPQPRAKPVISSAENQSLSMEGDEYVTIGQITQFFRVGKSTIYAWIQKGTFPASEKFGRSTRWSKPEIRSYMEKHKDKK